MSDPLLSNFLKFTRFFEEMCAVFSRYFYSYFLPTQKGSMIVLEFSTEEAVRVIFEIEDSLFKHISKTTKFVLLTHQE